MKFVIALAGFVAATQAVEQKSTLPKEMFEEIQRDMMDTHKKILEPFKDTSKRRKSAGLDPD
jgi:hypothetical protein